MQLFNICSAAGFSLVIAATSVTAARADKAGCEYKDIDVARYGEKPFHNPPEIVSHNGVLKAELIARYTDPNTTGIGGCGVKLRTYNG
jgi:hypothetical protein